jgi:hypothetical protein
MLRDLDGFGGLWGYIVRKYCWEICGDIFVGIYSAISWEKKQLGHIVENIKPQ